MHPSSPGQRCVSGRGSPRLTWALGRGPTSPASRTPPRRLPLCPAACPHAAGRLGTPRPPARTPPGPGSAATSGTWSPQASRVPLPRRGRPRAQPGSTRRLRRPPAPAASTTGAALTAMPGLGFRGLRPTQAWQRPSTLTSRAASWRPRRSRRGRTARGRPSAARPPSPPRPSPGRGDNCSAAPRRRHTSVC